MKRISNPQLNIKERILNAFSHLSSNEKLSTVMHHVRQLTHNLYRSGRRMFHAVHDATGLRFIGSPVIFLIISVTVGITLSVTTLYTPSYAVTVDGQPMGIVASEDEVASTVRMVEEQGSQLLGYDYDVNADISTNFTMSRNTDVGNSTQVANYLYSELEEVGASLRKYELFVNGRSFGVTDDEAALEAMLADIRTPYYTDATISSDFVENVEIRPVYASETNVSLTDLFDRLTENTTGETTYSVVGGDTFNGIAYRNDMSTSDLQALNPDVNINKLSIGDILNVKKVIPFLSVVTIEETTYEEAIPCPINYVDDNSIYEGDTRTTVKGVEGVASVDATITKINGYEDSREVHSTTTLREPTETTVAVGTAPRPKTASYGSYHWPIYGKITSYFGGRYIFGSYSYHSGIDIAASYGAPICAADGGTVTTSSYNGTYGNLVVITHDNGNQTYYAHNSSLLVSVGQKVYRGQVIAYAGSTGRSTGTHCHFEIRVNGTSVNPLSYLP